MFSVREAYLKLLSLPSPHVEKVQQLLTAALTTLLAKGKQIATDTNEDLRMYLIILENPLFLSPSRTTLPLVEKLVSSLLGLPAGVLVHGYYFIFYLLLRIGTQYVVEVVVFLSL